MSSNTDLEQATGPGTEALPDKSFVGKPLALRAEGGQAVTVKLRKTDYARLEHMKAFFRRYLGVNPSTAVLLRWMIEDQQRYVDELTELCGWLGLRHVAEARAEKVRLARVVQDDDRMPPELPDIKGAMPTFTARLAALNTPEKTPDEVCKEFLQRVDKTLEYDEDDRGKDWLPKFPDE